MDDIDDAIDRATDDEQPDEQDPEEPQTEDAEGGGSGDESPLSGFLPEMSGTGKPLEAYKDHPYRSLAGGAGGDVDADELREKGECHVARGMDGLLGGLIPAGHPFVDLAIGFVLITIAGPGDGDGDDEGYDGSQLGNEHMDDTPRGDYMDDDDLTTGDA